MQNELDLFQEKVFAVWDAEHPTPKSGYQPILRSVFLDLFKMRETSGNDVSGDIIISREFKSLMKKDNSWDAARLYTPPTSAGSKKLRDIHDQKMEVKITVTDGVKSFSVDQIRLWTDARMYAVLVLDRVHRTVKLNLLTKREMYRYLQSKGFPKSHSVGVDVPPPLYPCSVHPKPSSWLGTPWEQRGKRFILRYMKNTKDEYAQHVSAQETLYQSQKDDKQPNLFDLSRS